jgi:hypothetical protein
MHHYKNKNNLLTIVIKVWPQFLNETKKKKLLQICRHECNTF